MAEDDIGGIANPHPTQPPRGSTLKNDSANGISLGSRGDTEYQQLTSQATSGASGELKGEAEALKASKNLALDRGTTETPPNSQVAGGKPSNNRFSVTTKTEAKDGDGDGDAPGDDIDDNESENHPTPTEKGEISSLGASVVRRMCSGQVVTSLSTAVKELVENALDAGATRIHVTLWRQGLEKFTVADNGSGVARSNLEKMMQKHWTSKISSFEDLAAVHSFGFRGEALSSLCDLCPEGSIEVFTRTEDDIAGIRATFRRDGTILDETPQQRTVGTQVTISDLFSTLPVRRREFQRTIKTQFSKMLLNLQAYAIISSGVRISCVQMTSATNKKTILHTTGGNCMQANIKTVFGASLAKSLEPIDMVLQSEDGLRNNSMRSTDDILRSRSNKSLMQGGYSEETEDDVKVSDFNKEGSNGENNPCQSTGEIKLEGYVSKVGGGIGLGSSDRQFWFVNGRPVDFPKGSRIINSVYRQHEMKHKPAIFLNWKVPPGSYDINVTPDKREVFLVGEEVLLAQLKNLFEDLWKRDANIISQSQTVADMWETPRASKTGPSSVISSSASVLETESQYERSSQRKLVREEEEEAIAEKSSNDIDDEELISASQMESNDFNKAPLQKPPRSSNAGNPLTNSNDSNSGRDVIVEHEGSANHSSSGSLSTLDRELFGNSQASNIRTSVDRILAMVEDEDEEDEEKDNNEKEELKSVEINVANNDEQQQSDEDDDVEMVDVPKPTQKLSSPTKSVKGKVIDENDDDISKANGDSEVEEEEEEEEEEVLQANKRPTRQSSLNKSNPFSFARLGGVGPEVDRSMPPPKARPNRRIAAEPGQTKLELASAHYGGESDMRSNRKRSRRRDDSPDEASDESDMEAPAHRRKDHRQRTKSVDPDESETPEESGDIIVLPNLKRVRTEYTAMQVGSLASLANELFKEGSVKPFIRGYSNLKQDKSKASSVGNNSTTSSNDIDSFAQGKEEEGIGGTSSSTLAVPSLDSEAQDSEVKKESTSATSSERVFGKQDFAKVEVIGQFNKGFIIGRFNQDLFIFDQHACDEKYLFETLQITTKIQHQPLMRPFPVELSATDAQVVRDNLDIFEYNGFRFASEESQDSLGKKEDDKVEQRSLMSLVTSDNDVVPDDTIGEVDGTTQKLRLIGIPHSLKTEFGPEDVRELASLLRENPPPPVEMRQQLKYVPPQLPRTRAMFASRACRKAIMIGRDLDRARMFKVLRNMTQLKQPWNCPHGRPTMRYMCDLSSLHESCSEIDIPQLYTSFQKAITSDK